MTDGVLDDTLAQFWSPPEARRLPELRAALADQMANPFELEITAGALRMGRGAIVPPGPPEQAAATLLAEERRRLQAARLFLVTEEMTELARVAGAGLPDYRLRPEDLPCPAGLVVFSSSIGDYLSPDGHDGRRQRTHIVACSWGPTAMQTRHDGVWITFWCPINHARLAARLAREQGLRRAEAERVVWSSRGEMAWDNEAWMAFGGTDKVTLIEHNKVTGTFTSKDKSKQKETSSASWTQTLRAAWLLMTQPGITDVQDQPLPRRQQRRAETEGYNSDPVRVVRLRAHPAADPADGHDPRTAAHRATTSAGRDYTVRWMVRGHWRQQPHGPGRTQRRPVWINPHIKGPDGAPLTTPDTVYLVDRPATPTEQP